MNICNISECFFCQIGVELCFSTSLLVSRGNISLRPLGIDMYTNLNYFNRGTPRSF